MTEDTAHTAKTIADDALTVIKALGIVCPAVEVAAVGLKFVVDVSFAIVLHEAAKALQAQRAAQTAGVAAAAVRALRPRRSRVVAVVSVLAHAAPYVLAAVGWGLVLFGRNGR